jgi:hypothetical protein
MAIENTTKKKIVTIRDLQDFHFRVGCQPFCSGIASISEPVTLSLVRLESSSLLNGEYVVAIAV